MKSIFLTLMMILGIISYLDAQTFNMKNGIDTACSGYFYDNGGSAGNYSNSTNLTYTLHSSTSSRLELTFLQFNLYPSYDYLRIYDGPTTAYPLIGTYYGSTSPGIVTSSSTDLTFVFYSSAYDNSTGWIASINCVGSPLATYNMSTGFDTVCNSVFYDSGGPSSEYSILENKTKTFYAQGGQHLMASFNPNAFNLAFGDTLFVFDGNSTSSPPLATYFSGSYAENSISSGDALTFMFKSDISNQGAGWQIFLSCTSSSPIPLTYAMSAGTRYVCSGIFTDQGGSSGNYYDGSNLTQTFRSYNGNRLKMIFTQFSLYPSYDYLRIYDGPNTSSPIIGTYYGSSNPGIILSSGDALTYVFYSSSYDNGAGWQAQISCDAAVLPVFNMSNTITTACSGVFYDNGGAGSNYSDYQSLVHTFKSTGGNHLQFIFNPNALGLASDDTLWVFDGPTVNSNPIGIYVNGSTIEPIVSTDSALTFKFSSNYTNNAQGWQAVFSCTSSAPSPLTYAMSAGTRYVCSGLFTDQGGSTGNYYDGSNLTQTFRSYNGNRLKMIFTQFSLYPSYDYLRIYDGPTTNSPIIGTYYGTSNPGTILSSGDALTYVFYSSVYDNGVGWQAQISCDAAVLPVFNMSNTNTTACSGVFYDNSGASANYLDYQNLVHTFKSTGGNHLQFIFNPNALGLASDDTLWVFDGPTVNSNPLGIYVNGSTIEPIISTDSALTFKFSSNYTNNAQGWQAVFSCTSSAPSPLTYAMSAGTRYVCSGIFTDQGGSTGNYYDGSNLTQTFRSYNGNRLKMIFTQFSLYPSYDYLRIYDGPTTSSPIIGTYYGSSNPGTILSSGDALTYVFYSSVYDNGAGWQAQISCDAAALPVFNMSNTTTTACSGVFYDNSGASANYLDYQNLVHTFKSTGGNHLQFIFNPNALGLASDDTLWVFDGPTVNSNPIGIYVNGSTIEPIVSTDSALTFKFSSNYTNNAQGWQAVFSCTSSAPSPLTYAMSAGTRYVCSGLFTDQGGSTGNYYDGSNLTQTFRSYNGNRLKMIFTQFSLYPYYDYLRIYDGPTTSSPIIGTYYGTSNPGTILSSGDALTYVFYSSAYDNGAGWQAQISCDAAVLPVFNMSNTTTTACSGVFYDNSGASANYLDYQNLVHTFKSTGGNHLQFIFNPNALGLAGDDTLWVFDGSSISSQPIGVYVSGSVIEPITSTDSSLTFKFISNINNNAQGWQAIFNCISTIPTPLNYAMSAGTRYVCSGTFTDAGGPSGNYYDGENKTQTFKAMNGNRLKMIFNQFSLYSSYDYLKIYDGSNTSATLLGTYYYNQNPGTIISSTDALTFVFYSSAYDNGAGWNAAIQCVNISPALVQQQPSNKTVCVGDTAKFILKASGGTPISYQWLFNNSLISGANDSVYTITSVTNGNAGNYRCRVSNAYGFDTSLVATLSVNSLPTVSLSLNPVCLNATAFNLSGGSPSGGTYSGTAVSSNQFFPQTAGVGFINLTYTYTNSNNCKNTATASQEVKALPSVSFAYTDSFCQNSANVTLSGGSPSGGTYSGIGVSGSTFSPSTAGAGNHIITYSYTGGNSCTNSATKTIKVNSKPTVTFSSLANICSNVAGFTLTQGSPSGGVYSGIGVSSSSFSPSLAGYGIHTLKYKYTNNFGCSDSTTQNIQVYNAPTVNLNNFSPTCSNIPSLTLSGGSPVGGVYSGITVSSGVFQPSMAGSGSHAIKYKFTDAYGCSDSVSKNISVNAAPIVSFSSLNNVCLNSPAFVLSGGSPVGGDYFGSGVSNGWFNPSTAGNGSKTVGYSFTNGFGCSDTAYSSFVVYNLPSVSLGTLSPVCISHSSPITLNQGAPGGGVYSGTGVSGSSFNVQTAGVGNHTITYTITNGSTNCSNSAIQILKVNPLPSVSINGLNNHYCINSTSVPLTLIPTGGTLSGAGLSGTNFNPSTAGLGLHSIIYSYTDTNNCQNKDTADVMVHALPTIFAGNDTTLCEGNCVTYIASGAQNMQWMHLGAAVATTTVCPPTTTTYVATGSDQYTCSNTDSVTVFVNPKPIVQLGNDTSICANHTITINPVATNGTLLWSNGASTPSITIDSIGFGLGTHKIWLMATNQFNCKNSDTLKLTFTDCSGFAENGLKLEMKLYPNPASEVLNIESNLYEENHYQLQILSSDGKLVWEERINSQKKRIDISHLASGLYMIQIKNKNKIIAQKLLSVVK